ncbi:MAG: hypothetical protein GX325_04505 [Peptococcaceae bacterium]|nr:hypothetical protein [Peptococcaceae bacterium]
MSNAETNSSSYPLLTSRAETPLRIVVKVLPHKTEECSHGMVNNHDYNTAINILPETKIYSSHPLDVIFFE